VLREVWGQSVSQFADSNDGGRDGAFYGTWDDYAQVLSLRDAPAGPFVLQCKHVKSSEATLGPADLREEYSKARTLVDRGLCRTYVVMTNARVTGASEAEIRLKLRDAGVEHPIVLPYHWICETIASNRRLRLYVPRVYGLGDLSQILDERAYAQTMELMAPENEQISTFVVTGPYLKAARALEEHGFVLILGEPAVGKSVIALMLAIGAADNWNCRTIKASTASELVSHWNPHEPGQFFLVDDAFGAVRHHEPLSHEWSRNMDRIMMAVRRGARVVLTSRSYIYKDARRFLKEYSYPLMAESQVVVNAEDLTKDEKEQILYNHLEFGDQLVEVKRRMKPFLEAAAAAEPFRPEAARRLGLRSYTANLRITDAGLTSFMSTPRAVLRDVFDQLGRNEHAALTLVFTAGSKEVIQVPVEFTEVFRATS
jgi:hypothetical protein